MEFVSRSAAWRPHDKKGDTVDHSNALKAAFVVCLSNVFPSQEIAVKEGSQVGEINPMLIEIDLPLKFMPGDHDSQCICASIYTQPFGSSGL